jgi:hypothetical protein
MKARVDPDLDMHPIADALVAHFFSKSSTRTDEEVLAELSDTLTPLSAMELQHAGAYCLLVARALEHISRPTEAHAIAEAVSAAARRAAQRNGRIANFLPADGAAQLRQFEGRSEPRWLGPVGVNRPR